MTWMPIAAVIVAGTVATLTDWLFMGVLFHDRYFTYPEVWRPEFRTKGDTGAILYSCALGYMTAAAVIGLCMLCGASGIKPALTIAVLAWIAGPLVSAVTTGIWVKIDPAVTLAHSIGYLVRFLIAGLAAGMMLA